MNKQFNLLDRFVAFAGEIIFFIEKLPQNATGEYLYNQILRSSGSVALNFAESQSA